MSRSLLFAVAAVLLAAVLLVSEPFAPGDAQAATIQKCKVPKGTPVLKRGTTTTALPQPGYNLPTRHTRSVAWVLDLGKVPAGTTATLDLHVEWEIRTNDWDFKVTAGKVTGESRQLQPALPYDGTVPSASRAFEHVTLAKVRHCATVVVTTTNFRAVPAGELDPLNATLKVSKIRRPA